MAKNVTIYDIASRLNISPSTVSRALAGNPLISSRTEKLVRRTANEMGYSDVKLNENKANTVAIIVPEINNYFYSRIISSIQDSLRGNYLLSILCSENSFQKEIDIVSQLTAENIRCLIISQSMDSLDTKHLIMAQKRGINIILFNRVFCTGEYPVFHLDNYNDSYLLVNHLVSSGRTRIAFAAKHFNCPIYKERVAAYKDILSQNNIEYNPDYLIYSELTLDDTYEIVGRLIKLDKIPDAIIMPNFVSALQTCSVLKLNGLSVPQDVAVVSFDESPECCYSSPSITSIERPLKEIGDDIASAVMEVCSGDVSDNRSLIKIYSSNIIIRGSSLSY